ncbi:unnamed protein product [Nippostrongylus brasiliensis]|uniref:alpha-1,2-Mannosidase n=1 Tax=Nippostrongylus brasiliensis TaxID=27835 RepID=A0A158QXY1_NIPBR|nr:unnamed protein product [Nippostrongylus brasiliensis]
MSRMARRREPGDVSKFAIDLAVGGVSAAVSKTVVAPVERVKLLLQVQYSHQNIAAQNRYKGILDAFIRVPREQGFVSFWRGNLTNVMRYFPTQGFMDCLRKTIRSEGVVGLYRGFFISIQTYFLYRAVYFGMYDTIRQSIEKDKKNLHFVASFLIAQGVSICSAYLTYPWDTVRRRMMIKGTLSTGRAFGAAKRIVIEEGVRGLFKGALANIFRWHPFIASPWQARYSVFTEADRLDALREAREMFYFGYENYMSHAFPADELDPIHCAGRGHDHGNPGNININDVLGDYSLTLIDSLDTLVVLGDHDEFKRAVKLVINTVSFEKNTTVQVFEATIRVIGSLLSAHLIASDDSRLLGDFFMPDYDGELLTLAHELAARLLPAFEGTKTVLPGTVEETCTAGAGSLLVEFGILSRLLGDQTYEHSARRINEELWRLRDSNTGLPGNLINIQTGDWVGHLSGVGAGLDSYYEYFLKAYILFGESRDLQLFNEAYDAILANMRRGRLDGEPPLFVNVDARDGSTANTWVDALQVKCGFATVHNVNDGSLEDRMESFFLAETMKYLYLVYKDEFLVKGGMKAVKGSQGAVRVLGVTITRILILRF